MVTICKDDVTNKLKFDGLSTDTKPTGTFNGMKIVNGSSFFEMDTQEIYFYNEAANAWLEQPQ